MPATLLIADDDPAIRTLLRDFFEAQGYAVVAAADGPEALALARSAAPDLALLDVMMPGLDGLDVVRRLRAEGETPVILVTARVGETDRVVGLELGADDYVTKPFSLHELAARVRAVLRRARGASTTGVLRAGDLALDRALHRVTVGGTAVALTPSEFAVLAALLEASGRVLSRAHLLGVLGADDGSERTVDVHVRNLRAKVEAGPSAPRVVETVFGVGYRIAT